MEFLALWAASFPGCATSPLSWAILGIVFGVKGRKLAQPDQKGLATAGFVLGIIGTAIGALGIVCIVCAAGVAGAVGTGLLS